MVKAWALKALLVAMSLVFHGPFSAQASDIEDFISVQSFPLQDETLLKIERVSEHMILRKWASKKTKSCGKVLTFKGPRSIPSPRNAKLWIRGISNELATLNLDENIQLHKAPFNYNDLRLKITLLADRNLKSYDPKSVEQLTKAIHFAIRKAPENYYFFFGDYLDTETGWMTAVVLVKLDKGEALFLTNSTNCY